MRDVFSSHYQNNFWGNDESVSGDGSTMEATKTIRGEMPGLFMRLGVRSLLDIPCGDFHWLSQLGYELDKYIGADIVPELIEANIRQYGQNIFRKFEVLDVTRDRLPNVDLILCRDLLGHFSNADIRLALNNMRASGSKYLLATTFPEHSSENNDIETGAWRPINLASFYGLPDALLYINEHCTVGGGAFGDKSLGLWRLEQ